MLVSISTKADKDQNLGLGGLLCSLCLLAYFPSWFYSGSQGLHFPGSLVFPPEDRGHLSSGCTPGLGILLLLRVQILGLGNTTCPLLRVELCLRNRHIEVLISPTTSPQNVTLFENRSVEPM